MKRWISSVSLLLVSLMAPSLSQAQIENGDFSGGAAHWYVGVPTDWQATFPDAGGNPDGYGRIEAATDSEGRGCINQSFKCGEVAGRTVCELKIQYKLDLVEGQDRTTGYVVIRIDGQDVYTSPTGAPVGWQEVMLNIPCGFHTIGLCLEVGRGKDSWAASFDNIEAECQSPPVPVEPGTWGQVKALYR